MPEPTQELPPRRRRGRPRAVKHEAHTLWVTAEGWAWLTGSAEAKGHKSVSKWVSALGRPPVVTLSQSKRREMGQPTTFEADKDGSYAWSVAAVQERHGFRTNEEFARAFGVSRRTIESWRSGRPPSRLALEKLRHWARAMKIESQDQAQQPQQSQ